METRSTHIEYPDSTVDLLVATFYAAFDVALFDKALEMAQACPSADFPMHFFNDPALEMSIGKASEEARPRTLLPHLSPPAPPHPPCPANLERLTANERIYSTRRSIGPSRMSIVCAYAIRGDADSIHGDVLYRIICFANYRRPRRVFSLWSRKN